MLRKLNSLPVISYSKQSPFHKMILQQNTPKKDKLNDQVAGTDIPGKRIFERVIFTSKKSKVTFMSISPPGSWPGMWGLADLPGEARRSLGTRQVESDQQHEEK